MSKQDFDAWWDYSDPRKTEQVFRKHLLNIEEENLDYRLQLQTQIARCLGLQRQFMAGHDFLDSIEFELPKEPQICTIRYLLERGRLFNSDNQRALANPLFLRAYEKSKELEEDFFTVDAAHMLAICVDLSEQAKWSKKAINVASKSKDPEARAWLGALYNNAAWTCHAEGDFETALKYFEGALEFQEERKNQERIFIAEWAVARCLRSMGKLELALAKQLQLLEDRRQHDFKEDGFVFEEIGECLLELERADEAASNFEKALFLLAENPWILENEKDRLRRIKRLANL